jgi:TrmH family RNA methyltransferase
MLDVRLTPHASRMITSLSNPTLKLVRALQTQRRAREKEQLFVVEGVRLIEEAARARVAAKFILHTDDLDPRGKAALDQLARLSAQVYEVTPKVMASVSDTKTPSGLLAVIPFPSLSFVLGPWSFNLSPLSFVLVLDRISDPGNLGTILRTADAAGVETVFLAPGTVDAYNPKVVRSAMGAHFHLPIVETDWETLTDQVKGLEVWLAEAREGEPYDRVDWRKPCALILGSEAEGPSETARQFTPNRVHIPMPGQAESLNAAIAAGVLMFEVAKHRRG